MKVPALSIGLLLLSITSSWAGTCALCRQALESAGKIGLLNGFYWSIVLMAGIPLIIFVVGIRFVKRYW